MGFWSGLGKVLGVAAPIVAAPFTGGTSLAAGGATGLLTKIGKGLGAAAPALTGLTAGAAKGREAENNAAQTEAAFKLREAQGAEDALQNRAGLDLKQRQFGQDSTNNAFKNAIRSALIQNMKDAKIGPISGGGWGGSINPVQITGGMRPSALGAEGKAAASTMYDKAMSSLMNGETFDALPPIERIGAPQFKKPGAFENITGALGLGANAIKGAQQEKDSNDFQQKIMDAINKIGGNTTPGAPVPIVKPPVGNGGVTPFVPPPQAKFPLNVNPDDDGQ